MRITGNAKIKNIIKYIMPSLATAIIFCAVLIIKGIYPFGNATIDFYDLSDQGTPIYMHVYDAVHGHKNIFYDLYSALTTNMTGMLGTSGISPFNLYFLFIKRENVLKCMSIFILLKMMVMSLGMYLFLDKATETEHIYKLTFAVCYGFSGYVLLHYTSHIWFDNVAYFPFVMTGVYLLIKEGRWILYTVSMTLSLICGYYISFLFFIYIFLAVGLAVLVSKIKDESTQEISSGEPSKIISESSHANLSEKSPSVPHSFHLTELLVCTLASLAASAFVLLPQINQTLSSARFTNESGGGLIGMYTGILKNISPAYTSRWFVILNISFAAAIVAVGLIKYRKEKRLAVFTLCMLVITCSELFLENINLFWHYGSYVHYPLRNGFMIGFTLSYFACVYLGKLQPKLQTRINNIKPATLVVFVCISLAVSFAGIFIYSKNPGMSLRSVFHMLAAVMAVCFVIYVLLAVFKGGRYIKFAPLLIVGELIFYGFVFIGKPTYITGYTEEPEMERDSFYICSQLYDAFNLGLETEYTTDANADMQHENNLNSKNKYTKDTYMNIMNRVKNPDESLNSNYALVLRRSALSNWTALISPKLQESAKRLGYTVQYTRLLDSGGTVFSDALIGIKNIITYLPQDENLYELIDTADIVVDRATGRTDKYYYYKCKYELPWGIQLKDIDKIDFNEDDIVKLYNNIYTSIIPNAEHIDAKSCIASDIPLTGQSPTSGGKSVNQNITIEGNKALYYFSNQVDTDDYNTIIKINGNPVSVPSISEKNNILYPAHFNNNALYLGTYNNEEINIEINFSDTDRNGEKITSVFEPRLVAIDLTLLRELCDSYRDYSAVTGIRKTSYELNVEADENGYIMLPLSYDKGYKAYVNGNEENVEFLGGLFMAVPVYEGENSIIIKFAPSGFKAGVIITAVTILLIIIAAGHPLTTDSGVKAKLEVVLEKICILAWCVVILLMYVIPIIYSAVAYIIVLPLTYLLFTKAAALK